jgi:hypothetical protein
MIFANIEIVNESGQRIGEYKFKPYTFAEQLTHKMIIPQPSAFWRREVYNDVGSLRNDLHYAMDFEYWIRIGRKYPIYRFDRLIAQFRISSINKGSAQSAKWGAELIRILDNLYAEPYLREDILKLKKKAYAGACLIGATTCLTAYEMSLARHWLMQVVRYDPLVLASLDWWWIWLRAILGAHLYEAGRTLKKRLSRRISNSDDG